MKKILTVLPIVAILAACGTTDPYGKRAEQEREWNEKNAAFIKVYNQKVEEDGVALAEWRGF